MEREGGKMESDCERREEQRREKERSILKSGKMQRLREESLWQMGAKTVTDQVEKHWEKGRKQARERYRGRGAGYLGKEGKGSER